MALTRLSSVSRRVAYLGSLACLLLIAGCGSPTIGAADATSPALSTTVSRTLPTTQSAANADPDSEPMPTATMTTAPPTTDQVAVEPMTGTASIPGTVAGQTDPSSAASGEPTTPITVPTAADLAGIPMEELVRIPGTISYYLTPEYMESQESKDLRAATAQAVGDCMAAAGVSYEVPVPAMPTSDPVWDEFYAAQGTREYAQQWGYGLSVQPEYEVPDVSSEDFPSGPESDPAYERAWDGPLRTELNGLQATYWSGEKQEEPAAHVDRRINELSDAVSALDTATEIMPGAGCSDVQAIADRARYATVLAAAENPDAPPENPLAEFEPLMDEADLIRPAVLADPEMSAPLQTWQGCMAEAGYGPYTDPGGANREIFDRWVKIQGWEFPEAEHDYVGSGLFGGGTELGSEPPPGLAQLQKDEVAVARVDFDCTAPLAPVMERVTRRYEQDFVVEHQAELEDYRAAATKDW